MADLRSVNYERKPHDYPDRNDEKENTLFPMDEEFGNPDSLNDETFGSESFDTQWEESEMPDVKIAEFERWKDEQKLVSSGGHIPLDEAPAKNIPQDEEKVAEAISKLDNIDLSQEKESKDPLLNSPTIEALWPSSPVPSNNLPASDSPYLQDLLSPTHKIWGSPTSEEHQTINDLVDNERSNEVYSPVLEDGAIVSALPKRVSKAICAEDLEKIALASQVKLQRTPSPPSFVDGSRRVRPPPGLSPTSNVSPFPAPRSPYGMYLSPGQRNMNTAQAQAYYAAMMKQRMAYPLPFPRTPPTPALQPFPIYHSDPAHLRPRVPNVGIPRQHARFTTPQARGWNNTRGRNNTRGSRSSYENRRRPVQFPEFPKYRPQFYVESEDEDELEEGALMTAKEKDWLIRIQLMQLTTDRPELDDYYFHTFERRRLANERATHQTGVEQERHERNKDIEMTLPHVDKADCYKPARFEGSLGQLSVGSVQHPRQVIQVGDSGKARGPVGSLKETKKKYQLLLTIEKGFDQLLPVEDLERMALQMPQDVRPQLYERRDRLFKRCYELLGLQPSQDSNKKYDDDILLQMLSVRKGRRLLCKMLRMLREAQRHEIASAITRHMRTLTKKDLHPEEKDDLSEALADVIRGSPSKRVVEHYSHVVGDHDESVLPLFSSNFTLRILIELMKRTSVLAKNIEEDSLPLQSLWPTFLSLTIRDFVTASPKILARNYDEVENLVDLLNDNAEPSKLPIIQEHFRLVENTRRRSPQR